MNVYFRLRVEREGAEFTQLSSEDQAAFAQGQGVSDHPDRGYDGQPLHYAGIHALSPPVVVPVPVTAPAGAPLPLTNRITPWMYARIRIHL